MKAVVIHQYGGPDVLRWEGAPDPAPGMDEVLIKVAAASINPIDLMRRSGAAKDFMPVHFPGVLGADIAGVVVALGANVSNLSIGDRVFGMAQQTYAELCVAKAADLALIPEGLDLVEAAALPLVTTTGWDLIAHGAPVEAGQTVLVLGAAGSVGRSAVFVAKNRGAAVTAAVRRNQLQEAQRLGANSVVVTDDESAMAALPPLDAVADTISGPTPASVLPKIRKGGVFGTVLAPPPNARDYPEVTFTQVYAQADPKALLYMAQAVLAGRLKIPVARRFPLQDAAQAHAEAKGSAGKFILVVDPAA